MAGVPRWPYLSREQHSERIEGGLGMTRHKEYDVAPYAEVVTVMLPVEQWTGVFYSWLSLKGHLQGMHGVNGTSLYATRIGDSVYAMFLTLWRGGEEMTDWFVHGYPVEEMLRQLEIPAENIDVMLMRDFS